jgi:hypothetical protein
MQSSWIDKFTRGFFWFGFCVFLAASIPHIAAYYRHFDPNATGWADTAAWVIGYLIAIVIDVTDVLVSIAVLKEINRGTKKRHLLGYWAFIVFVMALSWFINWQYDIVYGTQAFARADSQQIFGILIGSVNPIIGSAFQMLLLVYTAMAHKFAERPVKKTAEQLRLEADELEQVAMQQARIDAVKKMQNDYKVGGLIDSLGQAKERAKTLFSNGQNQAIEPTKIEAKDEPEAEVGDEQNEFKTEVYDQHNEFKNDASDESNDQPKQEVPDPNSGEFVVIHENILSVLKNYPKIEALLSTGRPTFTLEEVSLATGYGVKLLANRIAKGELKRPSRSDKRIFKASLLQWLKTAPAVRQNDRNTGKIVAFKASQDEENLELVNSRQ